MTPLGSMPSVTPKSKDKISRRGRNFRVLEWMDELEMRWKG
jgi:hypothetical protein